MRLRNEAAHWRRPAGPGDGQGGRFADGPDILVIAERHLLSGSVMIAWRRWRLIYEPLAP